MEFRDKPMQNLVRIPEKDICKNAQKLLLDGETVVGAYKTVRDQVVFTTHRIILVDMQGVTGTRPCAGGAGHQARHGLPRRAAQ